MKKPKALPVMIIFPIVGILLPLLILIHEGRAAKLWDKYRSGREVLCEVTEVKTSGRYEYVIVKYEDDEGWVEEVSAIPNKTVKVGDTFKAYVIDSEPYRAYRPESGGSRLLNLTFAGIMFGAGALLLGIYLRDSADYRLMKKKGKKTLARFEGEREQNGARLAEFTFEADGRKQKREFPITKGSPMKGDRYQLRYVKKPSGKILAELVDKKLV
ncbi:MAG: hypothetical protein IJ737_03045 [Ruminococcus sp.]|nr:hypothetical protein [Ruminococcus sp.]